MNRPDIKRLPKRGDPLQAQKQLLDAVHSNVMPTETVALPQCLGRVLAKDVYSDRNIPEYDKTFIDGYAINTADTENASTASAATFRIVGKLFPADYPTATKVGHGEAVYVACGAPIPQGADATVKVEETRLKGDYVEVVRQIEPGEGVIPLGDDVKAGVLLLGSGQVLRPQDLGLLASIGLVEVAVVKKPRIAILSGGDELINQRSKNPEKIANNYALVVAGLASELGAETKLLGIMPDALDKVTAANTRGIGRCRRRRHDWRVIGGRERFCPRRRQRTRQARRGGTGRSAASRRNFRLRVSRWQTRRDVARSHRFMHRRILPFRGAPNRPLHGFRRTRYVAPVERRVG